MGTFIAAILLALLTLHQSRADLQHGTTKQTNITQEYMLETALVTRDPARRWLGISTNRPARNSELQRVQISIPLIWKGYHWVAPIDIGTPAKRFYVTIDTNSANFWINWDLRQYSLTRRLIRPGMLYEDYIDIGGLREEKQFITPRFLWKSPYDGVLGLRPSAPFYSVPKEIPFVPNFLQKYVDPPIFALYLESANPQLHIGNPQADYYEGDIEYHNVTNSSRWEIGPASMSAVDGATEAYRISGINTVFDSSIQGIVGPPSDVKKIYKALRKNKQTSEGPYTFPCSQYIEIHFSWNDGGTWINHQFGSGRVGRTLSCTGIIKPGSMFSKVWRIGTGVLDVYTVYDCTQNKPRMGFARLPSHLTAPPPYSADYNLDPPPPSYTASEAIHTQH